MYWFIRTFWKSLLAASAVLGVIAIPKSVQDRGQLLEPYQKALAVFDQNSALWAVCIALVTWIIWTDVRPFARKWREKPAAILIEPQIYAESEQVVDKENTRVEELHCVRFFVMVRNNRQDRQTLRRVTAKFHFFGEPLPLRCRSGDGTSTDIRHGETAFFELGYTYAGQHIGLPTQNRKTLADIYLRTAKEDVEHGRYRFEIAEHHQNSIIIMFPNELDSSLVHWVVVAADDVVSSAISITINPKRLPDLPEAFRITEVESSQ